MIEAQPTSSESAEPVIEAQPTSSESAEPVIEAQPTSSSAEPVIEAQPTSSESAELVIEAQPTSSESAVAPDVPSLVIERETYYAVDFIDRYYIGRTLRRSDRDGFWDMKFLHQTVDSGVTTFKWPATNDLDTVHESVIFYGPVALQGVVSFKVACLDDIKSAFEKIN